MGKDGEILDGIDGDLVFFDEGGTRFVRTGDIGEFDMKGIFSYCILETIINYILSKTLLFI